MSILIRRLWFFISVQSAGITQHFGGVQCPDVQGHVSLFILYLSQGVYVYIYIYIYTVVHS